MKNLQIGKWLAQYSERVALGVALVIMLLLSLWGLFSSGPDLTPQKIEEAAHRLQRELETRKPHPSELRRFLPTTVEEVKQNTEGVMSSIPVGAIGLDSWIGRAGDLGGLFRRNPRVLQPVAVKTAHVYVVHTRYVVEYDPRKKEGHTYVIVPKPGVKTPELKPTATKPNDPRVQRIQNLPRIFGRQWPQFGQPGFPGPGGPGGGLGPGGFPPGPGQPGEGMLPGDAGIVSGAQAVGTTTQYELKRVPITESQKYPLAEFLNCREAVLLVSAFPFAEQMQEIADALLLDRHQVQSLFKGIEVQKRVFALGDSRRGIPDEVIVWDRQTNQLSRVAYTKDLPNHDELGWLPVNVQEVALQVASAVDFEQEADPLWQVLLDYSRRLVMRLPKMQGSGTYPWKELALRIDEVKKTLEKIKQNQKLFEKPPQEDPRLKPDINEAFEGSGVSRPGVPPVGGEGSDVHLQQPPGGGFGSAPGGGPKIVQPIGPRSAFGSAAVGPEGPQQSPQSSPGPAPIIVTEWPDYCLVRFLDIFDRWADMRFSSYATGGRPVGVQYRIRILLQNPNYGEFKKVQRPEMARKEILEGPWSLPSEMLDLRYATYVYAELSDHQKSVARPEQTPLQIHRWLGLIRRLDERSAELAVGDWVIGSSLVARGEYVGQYAKIPLAVWAPQVVAEPQAGGFQPGAGAAVAQRFGRFVYLNDVETDAFRSGSILLDFENSHTWNSQYAFRKLSSPLSCDRELIPQEVLILTEDGRIIARNAQRDANDPERKKREEAWNRRLEEAKRLPSGATPNKPFDPFGGS